MQTTSTSVRPGGQGFAILITLVFLGVTLIIFASVMYWISGNAKITERNNQYNRSSGAAEAGVEMVLSQMLRDFNSGTLTSATYYASLPANLNQAGWPVTFKYSDPTGTTTNAIYVLGLSQQTNATSLNSEFTNLYGFAWNWTISAKATPVLANGESVYSVPATVTEQVDFASIPLFQFAIFYNIDMEIDPGEAMTVTRPVFCNKDIWAGASDLTFLSTVAAVGHVYTTAADPMADNYSGSGGPTFNLTGQPTSNNPSLIMPIGTNNNPNAVQAILELPPPAYAMGTAPAYTTNGQIYLANGADLYISNSVSGTNSATPTGTNTFVYYDDSALTLMTPDYYILKTGSVTNHVFTNLTAGVDCTTNVRYAGYSFITNAIFYDWREGWNGGSGYGNKGKTVQAVQIDISKYNLWLTNAYQSNNATAESTECQIHKGHTIDSMYVYTSVPLTTTNLPAVRIVNGALLPSPGNTRYGFTLATEFPLYVWGNYNDQDISGTLSSGTNTLHTYPSAFMADAITILSSAWSDTITSKNPPGSSATVNAAMLEGIVPSNLAISGNYSGGTENFMRLLETWSGILTYNGSIIVMFDSQYATNTWLPTGNYYNPPTRNWSFDLNFSKGQNYLPPLTPETRALIRGQWGETAP